MGASAEILFGGLFQGSLYAMMAVGLALVWTTIGVFNFSHGVFMMLGAYFAWQLVDLGLHPGVAFPLAVLATAAVGWALQAAVVRPGIRRAMFSIGGGRKFWERFIALCHENLTIWGPRSKQLPALIAGNTTIGSVGVSLHQIAIIVITPLILGGLWLFLTRTRTGLALRAVAQNEDASQLVGLNVTWLYGLAFAIAAALACLAGIFMGGYRFMSPVMGADPLLKALIVVVFGGISSISGPIFAAYLIGFFEAACSYYFGLYWTPALLFAVLILTLMVRPEGIFATRSRGLA